MHTIENDVKNETVINRSRFISLLFKIFDEKDVTKIIDKLKKKYKDANHYCYAYIIQNTKRFNDDGEPSGTAGIPILNVLENNDLNFILCVVVRYFGGIKLGTGGLIRAYSKGCREVILKSTLIELIYGYNVNLWFKYNSINLIEKLISDCQINNKSFDDLIMFNVDISLEKFDYIKKTLELENIKFEIKRTLYVKK